MRSSRGGQVPGYGMTSLQVPTDFVETLGEGSPTYSQLISGSPSSNVDGMTRQDEPRPCMPDTYISDTISTNMDAAGDINQRSTKRVHGARPTSHFDNPLLEKLIIIIIIIPFIRNKIVTTVHSKE